MKLHQFTHNFSPRTGAQTHRDAATAKRQRGFTIVELLVVIVVIAILAAISIVAYNGIQARANDSVLQSDLRNAATKLEMERTTDPDGNYPTDDEFDELDIPRSDGTTYQYTRDEEGYVCITADRHGIVYLLYGSEEDGLYSPVPDEVCWGHDIPEGWEAPPIDCGPYEQPNEYGGCSGASVT